MKKTFMVSVLCMISVLVSCKKDPKADKLEIVQEVVDTTAVVEEVVEEVKKPVVVKKKKKKKKTTKVVEKKKDEGVPPGAPTFESLAARKYVRDYEAYVSNYRNAVNSHADIDSFLKLSEASNSLTAQYRRLMSSLKGDEIEKMSKYMQKKSAQIDELSKKL